MFKKSTVAQPTLLALALSLSACAHNLQPAPCPSVQPPKSLPPPEDLMRQPSSQSFSSNAQLLFQKWRQRLTELQAK